MSISDTQKSEIHESTADAEGSPAAPGDRAATRQAGAAAPAPSLIRHAIAAPVSSGPVRDLHVIDDETDVGGPLVIESADPELNPPHVPIEEFPTDGTAKIDPKVGE